VVGAALGVAASLMAVGAAPALAGTGVFTQVAGSPFATGAVPPSVAFSPSVSGNLFAAVANSGDNTVSVYSVNQSTGVFTQVAGSPFATGTSPYSVAFSPSVSGNLFAAVANPNSKNVSVYAVNQSTGVFTQVAGSPFATGTSPYSVAFSPSVSGNLFAAVANPNSKNVSVYSVNQSTGVFTQVAGSPFATGSFPVSVAFSPSVSGNLFAAVANSGDNTVSVYSVNQSTGVFTQVAGSPFATGAGPQSVAFSPSVSGNLFAAVANSGDSTVSVYAVNQSTGVFTQVAGSPFATGAGPQSVAFSPSVSGNLFAAVANFDDNTVSVYAVNQSTGAFTQVAGSPFATGTVPHSVAFSPSVSGNLFAAVANSGDNTVSVYAYSIPTITLAPTTLPGATLGSAYSQPITASGGTSPYTYALTSGALPPGMSLSSSGLLAGTPTASGSFNFTITATDSKGFTGSQSYNLLVVSTATGGTALAPTSPTNLVACSPSCASGTAAFRSRVDPTDPQVTLEWGAPVSSGSSPVTSYEVYRFTSSTAATLIATVAAPTTTYVDSNVTPGVTYSYYVEATNAFGTGPPSNVVSITPTSATGPPPPSSSCSGATGNAAFICALYSDILGRTADSGGLSTWQAAMASGATSTQVAYGIATSSEYRTDFIEADYQAFLGRSADPGGLSTWMSAFDSGATDEQIDAGILGSPEFLFDSGGTNNGFVNAVYQDLLGRPTDSGGLATWGQALSNGVSRTQVAYDIDTSNESRTDAVQFFYATLLNRPADPGGLSTWVADLNSGATDEQVLAGIAGSPEFYSDATSA